MKLRRKSRSVLYFTEHKSYEDMQEVKDEEETENEQQRCDLLEFGELFASHHKAAQARCSEAEKLVIVGPCESLAETFCGELSVVFSSMHALSINYWVGDRSISRSSPKSLDPTCLESPA